MRSTFWLCRSWRWLVVVGFVALLACAPDAWARAGGGGHFSGGGGSGGGGGDGGSGGAFLVYLLIRLVVAYPAVGIPVVILVIVGLAYGGRYGKEQADVQIQGRGIRRGRELGDSLARTQGVAQIREADPDFDLDCFLARTGHAFRRVQDAWSHQDLAPIRHFVSDAVFERFSLQIAEMQQRGVRNIMENVSVDGTSLAQVDADDRFQTITVLIQASAIDYEVDNSGHTVFGAKTSEPFAEYWTFLRRPGAKTRSGNGLLEGHCPNCGAALQLNESAQCEFCGAKVRSGQYDWVLSEITQASEWKPAQHRETPGFVAMTAADPGFSLQHLEDRASVMFWRYIATWQAGKADPLRKLARESCCETLLAELGPDDRGVRLVPTEAAIGSVETAAIFCEEPLDQALLEVRWSCGQQQVLPDGHRRPFAATSFHISYFLLSRNHGVATSDDGNLASAHCPGCGAPVVSGTANACEYCGTILNQGDRDWVLDGIFPRYSPQVTELFDRLRDSQLDVAPATGQRAALPHPVRGAELLAWMVHVMLADDEIDAKEEQLLATFADRQQIGRVQMQQMINAMRQGQLGVSPPYDQAEARQWLEAMAEMALADGFIAPAEEKAMLALGQHLELTRYDVRQIISNTRKRLYLAEKQRLRNHRQS